MSESKNPSGLAGDDFTGLSLQSRMSQGRDIGEPFIIGQLARHGVEIVPCSDYDSDARMKIDGHWNGEPIQIKLRRSSRDDRNDIAYEVLRNHRRDNHLMAQLEEEHQQGRDWRGTTVKHYFVMNRDETEIYHVSAAGLKQAVELAIDEMHESHLHGRLRQPFQASNGVDLRPTRDRDPQSFTPNKVMAFIPVEQVAQTRYAIQKEA